MYRLDSEQVLFKWGFPALRLVTFRSDDIGQPLGSVLNQRPQQHLKETPMKKIVLAAALSPGPESGLYAL